MELYGYYVSFLRIHEQKSYAHRMITQLGKCVNDLYVGLNCTAYSFKLASQITFGSAIDNVAGEQVLTSHSTTCRDLMHGDIDVPIEDKSFRRRERSSCHSGTPASVIEIRRRRCGDLLREELPDAITCLSHLNQNGNRTVVIACCASLLDTGYRGEK